METDLFQRSRPINLEEIKDEVGDPERAAVYGLTFPPRLNGLTFFVRLEYEHFEPDTPSNERFYLYQLGVPVEDKEMDILVTLATFPSSMVPAAQALAKELWLVMDPGAISIVGKGVGWNPPVGPATFNLIYDPQEGLEETHDDFESFSNHVQTEREAMARIFSTHRDRFLSRQESP